MAKHGNRAASSKSGAADCLEALGVNIQLAPEQCVRLLKKIGICFFFAQKYHTSMKYVGPVRKELGVRTVFNLLGPLTNPGHANLQVLGVYAEHLVEPMAFTIDDTKLKRAGLDYWKYLDVTTYPSLENFMERHKDEQEKMYYFTTKAQHIYTEVQYPDGCWLLFGREDAGLPEELLVQHPARCLRFPMRQGLRSLNLSNSVAIGVYEALRQWDFPQLQNEGQLHRLKWE